MSTIKRKYKSASGIKYAKDNEGNLFIEIETDENKTENLCITGFEEGDYGLWIEEKAPYFIEGSNIVSRNTGTKASKSAVLGLEENKFLKDEDRIKDDFLWIYRGETIVFPSEQEEESRKNKVEGDNISSEKATADEKSNNAVANNSSNQAKGKTSSAENSQDSSSGGGQLYVCGGAELKCSCGDQTSNLQVVSGHNAKVCGNLIANIMDYKPMTNIMPFGNCQTTSNPQVAAATSANGGVLAPQPCVPNIPAPWAKVKKDVKVGQQAALLEGSLLTCAYGGQIEIVDPGQSILQE